MAEKTIIMLTQIVSTTWSRKAGEEITLSAKHADRLVQSGQAEYKKGKPGRPKKNPVEKAALRTKAEE